MLRIFKNMEKREVWMVVFACLLIVGQVYFDLMIPEFIDQMTQVVSGVGRNLDRIWMIGLQMLGCLCASLVLSIITSYLVSRTAAGFTFILRKKVFDKVLNFSDTEVLHFTIPSLITRTTNDITQIQTLISMGLQIVVKAPITAVWAILKIAGKNWELTALTAAFVAVVCVSVLIVMWIVLPRFRKIQLLTDKINLLVRENLTGINVVHAFNAREYQNEKFQEVNKDITFTQLFNQRVFSGLQPIIELVANCLWFSIYWLGAAILVTMELSDRIVFFGDIIAFAMYANYILVSFMMMVMIFMMFPPAIASAERINAVLDSDIVLQEGDQEVKNITNNIIEFRDVYFKYPKTRNDMLKKINFEIKKGETVAIIGSTGSGKTTLVDLMMRFYDATAGQVILAGKDIKSYNFETLYNTVCVATQKPIVFYGSITDNINFGEHEHKLTEEDIDNAIKISQSTEFVNSLKEGKDTIVSQGGKDISGGQKQRLSIARAIARKPEILILDDSFSALDYKTDALLRHDLKENLKDTTLIMVAQRIGTIKNADKILVLENGELVGIGKHEHLLKVCKTYQELAISQMKSQELNKTLNNG